MSECSQEHEPSVCLCLYWASETCLWTAVTASFTSLCHISRHMMNPCGEINMRVYMWNALVTLGTYIIMYKVTLLLRHLQMSLPSSCLSWSFCLAPWFCIPSLLPTVWLWVHEGQGFSPQSYTANTKGNQLVYGWIYSEILLYITCAIVYKSRAQGRRVNRQLHYFSNKGWIEKGQIHLDIA